MTRTNFSKQALREQVEAFYDSAEKRLRALIEEVESENHAAAMQAWREKCMAAITRLAKQWEDNPDSITNYELNQFQLPKPPDRMTDKYEVRQSRYELENIASRKSRALALVDSMVADEEGNISLLKSQTDQLFVSGRGY